MGNYDCDQCDRVTKLMWGCEDETAVDPFVVKGEHLWRCPKKLHDLLPDEDRRMMSRLMLAYYYSERGILPKAGGFEDQDPFVMNCIPMIHNYVESESQRKIKAQAAQKPIPKHS